MSPFYIKIAEIIFCVLPETVAETVPETVTETLTETVAETVAETVPKTVTETVTETVPETVPETVGDFLCKACTWKFQKGFPLTSNLEVIENVLL